MLLMVLLLARLMLITGRPLPDDGQPDVEGYNKELRELGNLSWFSAPWLYAECYLYRYGRLYSEMLI